LRNAHSYHDDYLSEKQIYDQATDLLLWLKAWLCPASVIKHAGSAEAALPACAYSLARDMATYGFWGPADAELVRHFFHDLARIGYKFPAWTESSEGHHVRACQSLGSCKADDAPFIEKVASNPSISLYGTCDLDVPSAAVVNTDV
jgi:hypothetical protein